MIAKTTTAALIGLFLTTALVPAAQAAPRRAAQDRDTGAVYGDVLAGQAAMAAGDARTAAQYFAAAKDRTANDAELGERIFTAALLAGDVSKAAAVAPVGAEEPVGSLATLTKAVDALASRRGREAYALLREARSDRAAEQAGALLRPWAAAAAGRTDESVALLESRDRTFNLVAALSQGQLLERARRYDAAENTFKAGMTLANGKAFLGPAFGLFLERRGRYDEAKALYLDLLAEAPGDAGVRAAYARASGRGRPPAMPSIEEGAAQVLMAPAAAMMAARRYDSALVYLRLMQRLQPDREDTWLLLAELMNQVRDVDGARDALNRIRPGSTRYIAARTRLALSYQKDNPAEALRLARETATLAKDDPDAQLALADVLRAQDRFDESAAILDALIAADPARADWTYYYMRGAALERAGRWEAGQADMQKALSLRPDEPELLNYLGYAWVDRGERVREGLAMIEKAVAADPDNGAYIDSLGWAHYRLGDYQRAVEKLEDAVKLAPGDAEINDHLGDAYWKAGRREEARYKWRSVLTLEPSAAIKARAESKLASPLGPDARVTAAAPAARP